MSSSSSSQFRKYNSIDNINSKNVLQYLVNHGHTHPSIEWVKYEKIHIMRQTLVDIL